MVLVHDPIPQSVLLTCGCCVTYNKLIAYVQQSVVLKPNNFSNIIYLINMITEQSSLTFKIRSRHFDLSYCNLHLELFSVLSKLIFPNKHSLHIHWDIHTYYVSNASKTRELRNRGDHRCLVCCVSVFIWYCENRTVIEILNTTFIGSEAIRFSVGSFSRITLKSKYPFLIYEFKATDDHRQWTVKIFKHLYLYLYLILVSLPLFGSIQINVVYIVPRCPQHFCFISLLNNKIKSVENVKRK